MVIIVHAIAQPVNAIKILAEGMLYLAKREHKLSAGKLKENLSRISAQAERIGWMIDHLSAFVKEREFSEAASCNLNTIVARTLELFGNQLAAHGIAVTCELADDLADVYGREMELEEVVINLLANSLQALDKLECEEKEIRCVTRMGNGAVVLEISEYASGISQGPFLHPLDCGEGREINLVIVEEIVKMKYGGDVEVLNNPDGGMTYKIKLIPVKQ